MTARLESGVRSLHLVIDRPIERYVNNEPEYRNDLSAVMVWCSPTPGFTPGVGTLVFNGLSMDITITALQNGTALTDNTTYYVKYALISEIDDSFILYSPEIAGTTTAGITSVVANLTNDFVSIPTDSAGNNAVYTTANTTMQVFVGQTVDTGWTFYVSEVSNVKYRDNNDVADRTGIGATNGLIDQFPLRIVELSQDVGYVDITAQKSGYSNITKRFSLNKNKAGVSGTTVTFVYLESDTNVVYKNSPDAATSGTHTSIIFYATTVTGNATPVRTNNVYYYTITSDADAEPARALVPSTGITFTPADAAGKSRYTIRLYSAATGGTLLDTEVVPVVFRGITGTRTATLELYQWSVNAPTAFPSGTSTYTWATGAFTAPATLNNWTLVPATAVLGQTLWGCKVTYSDTGTSATSVVTWNTSTAYPVGASGTNGTRTATLELYRWSANAPTTFPSGTSTYTWATGAFTAPATLNSWSITPPAAVVGQTLWGCKVTYSDTGTSATSTVTWNTSTAYPVGASGTDGVPALTATMSGGTRSVTYDQYGYNPFPRTSTQFSIGSVYYGSALVTTGITYSWSATGIFSGTSSTSTFTPTIASSASPIPASSISCTITYAGISVTITEPISATQKGSRSVVHAYTEARDWSDTEANRAIYNLIGGSGARVVVTTNASGQIASVSLNNAGSGYSVGDQLSVEGPGLPTSKITLTITAVTSPTGGVSTFTAPTLPAGSGYTASQPSTEVPTKVILLANGGPIFGDRVSTFTDTKWLSIRGAYSASTLYFKNDIVRYSDIAGNLLYRLKIDSSIGTVPTDTSAWQLYGVDNAASTYISRGNWTIGTLYSVNDLVTFTTIFDESINKQVLARTERLSVTSASSSEDYLVYSGTTTTLAPGDAVILSEITGSVGLTANTIYYVVSASANQLKLSTNSSLTSIVNITNNVVTCKVNKITPQEFICVIPHRQVASGTTTTDNNYTYADFIQGTAITKTFASGQWTDVVAYFDGNVIITGTLSVDALKSGSAVVGNTRGTFGLGGTDVLFNRQATARFTSDSFASSPLLAINTRASETEEGHSVLAGTLSRYGFAFAGYNAKNTTENYRSVFAGGSADVGFFSKKILEGNTSNYSTLFPNVNTIQTDSYNCVEGAGHSSNYYVEYTKVFNGFNTNEVQVTTNSVNITITNHKLSPNSSIFFDTFNSGTNFVSGQAYWVKSVVDANTITIYPVGSYSSTLNNVAITGTAGQFSCGATNGVPGFTLKVHDTIRIVGTNTGTGTISGYTSGTTYFITATNGSTTFTLSATRGGAAITTTVGTVVGLVLTRTPGEIAFDGTLITAGRNPRALVKERVIRKVTLTKGSSTITITGGGNHNLYANAIVSFSNTLFGPNFTDAAYRVSATNLTATSFEVYKLNDGTKTSVQFDAGPTGYTTSDAVVVGGNPRRTNATLAAFDNAGRFLLNSDNQQYVNSIAEVGNASTAGKFYGYTSLTNNLNSVVELGNISDKAGNFKLYDTDGVTVRANVNIAHKEGTTYYALYSSDNIKTYSAGGFAPFTGSHIGVIDTSTNIELGDIVVDIEVKIKQNISNSIVKFALSSTPNQKGTIGVVSELEAMIPTTIVGYEQVVTEAPNYPRIQSGDAATASSPMEPIVENVPIYQNVYTPTETEKFIGINALGEGQINVCGLGGNIEIGDLIVSSSIPGKGMKQADDIIRNYTVAKSREDVTFDYPEQIKQVACIYLGG